MNARLYDPRIGRFFSPDNYITDVENPQNYNRYSYALNNPLSYVDPSGNEVLRPDNLSGWQDGSMDIWMGGLTLSLLSIELDLPSNYLLDISKLEFYVTGNVFFTFAKYLLSPTGGWGSAGKDYVVSSGTKSNKNNSGRKMPREITFRREINGFTFSSLSESDKKKASENYTKAVDGINELGDYNLPENLLVVAATSDEIKSFSADHKEAEFIGGMAVYDIEVDGEQASLMFISTEYLLSPEGLPKADYERADIIKWERFELSDIILHEMGHFDGYCNYPGYLDLNPTERENYAIYFRNKMSSFRGRPPQLYERVWPWQLGGWFNHP